jgi:glycosyltransferase involved in cell wall biosynthesis
MNTSFPSISVTAVILTKNEENMIMNCLETLTWCDEVVVLDDSSTDATAKLAESWGARVIGISTHDFAKKRMAAIKYVKTDWVIFIDADERVTPKLYREIAQTLSSASADLAKKRQYNTNFMELNTPKYMLWTSFGLWRLAV